MEHFDFLVVGAGIAGLRAAVRLAEAGTVLVVTKEALQESNTAYAQGGIAVAMGGAEDVALHLQDTLAAGDGLVDRPAASVLVEQGPPRVEELLGWGTAFDREDGELLRTREGAHSLSRILHANGDGTGREIAQSLQRHVCTLGNVTLREWTTSVDLLLADGRVTGASMLTGEEICHVGARAVLLASGGAGQVYSNTTNPEVATGDGIAMAYRAGAAAMDMEFYQFHPTAFSQESAPRFLLSEALRGEGAVLLNAAGERFMHRYHPLLELGPRDVVARAIAREASAGPVWLDMRHVAIDPAKRFPGISAFLAQYGLSLGADLIPVAPAAHYLMGGIRTDVDGRTGIPGLFAAGETACTGVHGANRLASNSLLEGLVFGKLAAEAMIVSDGSPTGPGPSESECVMVLVPTAAERERITAWVSSLRGAMWQGAGLLRDAHNLAAASATLDRLEQSAPVGLDRSSIEARNLLLVGRLIVVSAQARQESRGGHYREDFPTHGPEPFHSVLALGCLTQTPALV